MQQPSLLSAVENPGQALLQSFEPAESIGGFKEVDVFVGKIEAGFDQRAQLSELVKQDMNFV